MVLSSRTGVVAIDVAGSAIAAGLCPLPVPLEHRYHCCIRHPWRDFLRRPLLPIHRRCRDGLRELPVSNTRIQYPSLPGAKGVEHPFFGYRSSPFGARRGPEKRFEVRSYQHYYHKCRSSPPLVVYGKNCTFLEGHIFQNASCAGHRYLPSRSIRGPDIGRLPCTGVLARLCNCRGSGFTSSQGP